MEFRHLRYFVAVAEERNISRAARRLHVSQPPLSRQMRDLESDLGFALLRRSARSIQLTEAGQVFLDEARATLQRLDDAVAFARAFAHQERNHLSVGHTSTLAIELLPRALRTFQRSHPQVKIELRTMTTLQLTRALNSGELDLAITQHGEPSDFPGLNFKQIGTCEVRVAVHKHHRFARMRKIPIRELVTEPIISLSQTIYPWYSNFVFSILSAAKSMLPDVEEHDNAQSLIAAVEAGRGAAIFYAVMSKTVSKRVVLRPLTPAPPPPPIVILYRNERVTPLIKEFMAAARAAAA